VAEQAEDLISVDAESQIVDSLERPELLRQLRDLDRHIDV